MRQIPNRRAGGPRSKPDLTPTQGNQRAGRTWRTVAVMSLLALAIIAIACHRSAVRHQQAIHSTTDLEEYCLDVLGSTIDESAARAFLAETLFGSAGDLEANWDQIDGTQSILWAPAIPYFNRCEEAVFQMLAT